MEREAFFTTLIYVAYAEHIPMPSPFRCPRCGKTLYRCGDRYVCPCCDCPRCEHFPCNTLIEYIAKSECRHSVELVRPVDQAKCSRAC